MKEWSPAYTFKARMRNKAGDLWHEMRRILFLFLLYTVAPPFMLIVFLFRWQDTVDDYESYERMRHAR